MSEPKCMLDEPGRDIVGIDLVDGQGFCLCILPKTDPEYVRGERVQACWFRDHKHYCHEYYSLVEAAKFGGFMAYAASIIVENHEELGRKAHGKTR